MASHDSKGNHLQQLPFGQLATRQWLLSQGATVSALDNALKSGKLEALARGVVARPGVPVPWQGVAASLHRMQANAVWVGGATALAQHGLAHAVQFETVVDLYSPEGKPNWLDKLGTVEKWRWHGTARLWNMAGLLKTGSLQSVALHEGSWLLASPEQAWLEWLQEVPERVSFAQADQVMQGLVTLSPRRLDALLKQCRHVQAKRLFFFFAERHQPAWYGRLESADYDLGRGKRALVAHGKLNRRWQITVPETFHDG